MIFIPTVRTGYVAKPKPYDGCPYGLYTPVPPRIAGTIKILSTRDVRISPDLCDDGVEIRFNNVREVIDLIKRLTKLRDDMIDKGAF